MKYIKLDENGAVVSVLTEKVGESLPVSDQVAQNLLLKRQFKSPQRQAALPEKYYIFVEGKPTLVDRDTSEGQNLTPDFPITKFVGYDEAEILESVVLESAKLVASEKQALDLLYYPEDAEAILKPEIDYLENLSKATNLKGAKSAIVERSKVDKPKRQRKAKKGNSPTKPVKEDPEKATTASSAKSNNK